MVHSNLQCHEPHHPHQLQTHHLFQTHEMNASCICPEKDICTFTLAFSMMLQNKQFALSLFDIHGENQFIGNLSLQHVL
jgi:hypothetical protein